MATEAGPAEIKSTAIESVIESGADGTRDRRVFPRYSVDCSAKVQLLTAGNELQGRLRDLSMGGCHLETDHPFIAGVLSRVEVQFQLRGIAFRLVGVTAGRRSSKSLAIRFLEMSRNRQEELAEVIAEVAVANEAKAAEAKAAEAKAAEAAAKVVAVQPAASGSPIKIAIQHEPDGGEDKATPAAGEADRRAHRRHVVDSKAKLFLVKTAIVMDGRVQDLSLGGCRLRANEPFNVGIFVRVEAEFYLHGMPFRVAGVIQTILDKNTIGIRFLDMSERRRKQLTELVAEMEAAQAS